ncbi:MAG: hypothetical protein WBF90_02310 [Rivularia sp. (in: cyanobacteria)]
MAFQKNAQQTSINPKSTQIPSSHSASYLQVQQPVSLYSASKELLSSKSPVSVAPLSVTKEEITLRERQVKIAEEDQRYVEGQFQAGVAGLKEKYAIEYFVLSNKIKLLQAKELLRLKQQQKVSKKAMN